MEARERGIIFSGEMVRAILEGRKTQTRRVIKPQPHGIVFDQSIDPAISALDESRTTIKCPYPVGTRLWVRETFCKNDNKDSDNNGGYEYRADYYGAMCIDIIEWKPSIFMPRRASRINIMVTKVRVERPQDISGEDAEAEGLIHPEYGRGSVGSMFGLQQVIFPELWNTINKKRGYGWDVNPWVFVYDFEVVK